MAEDDGLEGLEGLHRDLLILSQATEEVLVRLINELSKRVGEFRALLDKPRKDDKSRQALSSGTLKIDDVEYSINEEFKQEAIQLADALDLNELESAKILLFAQEDAQQLDRSLVASAVIRFHKKRHFLLECLRLTIQYSMDDDLDERITEELKIIVREILEVKDGQIDNGPRFWKKCLSTMADIEKWLQQLAERIQSASIIGQNHTPELMEINELQRSSLTRQHESLSAICVFLVKGGYTNSDCLRSLLPALKAFDRLDITLVHYLPITMALIGSVAASESSCSLREARELHQLIVSGKENNPWPMRNLHAAIVVWWLAEYSGRYVDHAVGSPLQGVDLNAEADARSDLFMEALKDNAFHFMLSVSQDIRPEKWVDPAKSALLSFLLQEAIGLPADTITPSDFFQVLLLEELQSFVEAFITNMPDTLRRLKFEEDGQRRMLNSRFQRGPSEYEAHLERFFVIIAYAFDGSPEAAQMFWSDPDGNLFGFLQWAAKRQPTPRIAAFCEMLRSISTGEECADAAHRFLIEESASASGKLRRSSSLSYSQIFSEIQFYAQSAKDKQPASQGHAFNSAQNPLDQILEPETGVMLECFLRLLAHIFAESPKAREWIIVEQGRALNLPAVLFELCSATSANRLRASAFTVLTALLTNKTLQLGQTIWASFDDWVASAMLNQTILGKPGLPITPNRPQEDHLWDALSSRFEEASSLVDLLQALLTPYPENSELNDVLPFPESIGSAHRMPGVDQYVDFVLGRVFAIRSAEQQDTVQQQILRLKCLDFAALCLRTFNQDLVLFANRSNIAVDSAIGTSSLAAYARLHPFARVMEWLFNEKVLATLFATANQDPEAVNDANTDSPLIISVTRAIEVMDIVMQFQSTYLDIVRPLIKLQSTGRRPAVANSALASFEDAVLNNLQLIVNLGLYCGTGHQDLTVASLQLLEKLASSRKLMVSPMAGFGNRSDRSRIISIMEKDDESERIAKSLRSEMQIDMREIEIGPAAAGFVIKLHILNFLISCLASLPNRPTVAHLLLGFSCNVTTIDVADNSLFATGDSLFHSILRLAVEYPDADGPTFISWLSTVKRKSTEILRRLVVSPLSSLYVMTELRANDYLFIQALRQVKVDLETLWDGRSFLDPTFFATDSAIAFENFLYQRSAFYDYIARELRMTVQGGMPTLRERIQSTLLGVSSLPSGEQVPNLNVFDLADFLEFESSNGIGLPPSNFFGDLDFSVCKEDQGVTTLYNLQGVRELLLLRSNELRLTSTLSLETEAQIQGEMEEALLYLQAHNRLQQVNLAREDVLKTWVQLMKVALESCQFETTLKTSFILQSLQVLLPKWERSCTADLVTAVELAGLARSLLQNIDFSSTSFSSDKPGDFANDRLFQLFRISLHGIFSPVSTSELREICYQICFRYLRGVSRSIGKGSVLGRHMIKTIKAAGERLLDVLCDDAYAGQGTCKVSALLLLEIFVSLAIREDSKYIVDSLVRLNFIGVLVDNIKHIATELSATKASEVSLLLAYYDAGLALLLRVCQTRLGAAHVLNAGLFQAIHESQIFSADPDIGLEFENPHALRRYFELMLSILRVINAAVLSRGPQNDQTLHQAREFLKQNRGAMVAVFKRNANVGGVHADNDSEMREVMDALVDNFTLLVSATGFLDYEDQANVRKSAVHTFS